MNRDTIISVICLLMNIQTIQAQTINWADTDSSRNLLASGKIGAEFGVCYGFGVGYKTEIYNFPILIDASISLPVGDHILDDKKVKLGGTIKWYTYKGFTVSTNIHGVYRSFQNAYVHLDNFGSDLSANIGYYAPHWFFAGEVGFDKAIATKYEHTTVYQNIYPEVVDGWYEPASGGNFYYGITTGASIYQYTIGTRVGRILNEDFYAGPLLPFYAELHFQVLF